jgi:hypothetical protein
MFSEGIRPQEFAKEVAAMRTTTTTTTWSPTTHADYDALKGREVFSTDGEQLGTIGTIFHPDLAMPAARGKHYLQIEPGLVKDWFGGMDTVYLPESAIDAVSPDRIALNLTAAQVKQRAQEFGAEPAGLSGYRRA